MIGQLEKIAEGLSISVIGIDYANQYIEDGNIKREEVIPYLERAFRVIKEKSVYPRANICVPEGYTWDMVGEAIEALEAIKKNKPIYFRGHII